MSRFEKILLVLTCVGGFASGIFAMLEKWNAIPPRVVTKTEWVRVEVTPYERAYCESKFCVYATPDGLRISNYTQRPLHCETMQASGGSVVADSTWWAIGRPGPFLKCVEE